MSGVVDYKQVAITDQWAEYEVELKSGAANASIQLYAYQSPIYIDDIKVTQTVKIDVPAPEALAATNVTPTSFTANWSAVEGATSYMLTVFSFKTIKSDVEEATVTEGFDGIVATGKKDKFIDTENSKLPEGWTISVSDNGTSREIYASSGNYHSEKIALAFDATGDFIETPEAPAPIKKFRLWVKNQGAGAGSIIAAVKEVCDLGILGTALTGRRCNDIAPGGIFMNNIRDFFKLSGGCQRAAAKLYNNGPHDETPIFCLRQYRTNRQESLTKEFASEKGGKPQEYFMYFKVFRTPFWRKKSVRIRRRICAVLPLFCKRTFHYGSVQRRPCKGSLNIW